MGFRGTVSTKYVIKSSSLFLFHALRALGGLVPFKTKGGSIVQKNDFGHDRGNGSKTDFADDIVVKVAYLVLFLHYSHLIA